MDSQLLLHKRSLESNQKNNCYEKINATYEEGLEKNWPHVVFLKMSYLVVRTSGDGFVGSAILLVLWNNSVSGTDARVQFTIVIFSSRWVSRLNLSVQSGVWSMTLRLLFS